MLGLDEVVLAGVVRDASEEQQVFTVLVFPDVSHEQLALLCHRPVPGRSSRARPRRP
jgi:hypothetical protein